MSQECFAGAIIPPLEPGETADFKCIHGDVRELRGQVLRHGFHRLDHGIVVGTGGATGGRRTEVFSEAESTPSGLDDQHRVLEVGVQLVGEHQLRPDEVGVGTLADGDVVADGVACAVR